MAYAQKAVLPDNGSPEWVVKRELHEALFQRVRVSFRIHESWVDIP